MHLEGECGDEHPVGGIREFMYVISRHEAFLPGEVLSIEQEGDLPAVFNVQIPLRGKHTVPAIYLPEREEKPEAEQVNEEPDNSKRPRQGAKGAG